MKNIVFYARNSITGIVHQFVGYPSNYKLSDDYTIVNESEYDKQCCNRYKRILTKNKEILKRSINKIKEKGKAKAEI